MTRQHDGSDNFRCLQRNPVGGYAQAMNQNPTITVRDLYPDFSEKEFSEAEDTLDHYLALVLRIFERVEAEKTNPQVDQLTPNTGTLPCTPPGLEVSG